MNYCGLVWPFMVLHDLFWHYMVLNGLFADFYGLLWQNIDLIGLESSFLAVIDPNSFGLVFTVVSLVDKLKGSVMFCFNMRLKIYAVLFFLR